MGKTAAITEEQWQEIDRHIIEKVPFRALLAICTIVRPRMGLREAADFLDGRYRKLRAKKPEQFDCDDIAYWKDWYS